MKKPRGVQRRRRMIRTYSADLRRLFDDIHLRDLLSEPDDQANFHVNMSVDPAVASGKSCMAFTLWKEYRTQQRHMLDSVIQHLDPAAVPLRDYYEQRLRKSLGLEKTCESN